MQFYRSALEVTAALVKIPVTSSDALAKFKFKIQVKRALYREETVV